MDSSVLNPGFGTRKQISLRIAPPQFDPTGLYWVWTIPAPACTKKFGWLKRLNTAWFYQRDVYLIMGADGLWYAVAYDDPSLTFQTISGKWRLQC